MVNSFLHQNPWLAERLGLLRRLLIIGACFGLAWLLGGPMLFPKLPLIGIGVAGIVVMSISLFKLDVGIFLLLFATLFLPIGIATGTQSSLSVSLVFTAALTGAWVVRMLLEKKRLSLLPSPLNKPLLIFALVCIVSFFWSGTLKDPLVIYWESFPRVRLGALATLILSPAAALLVSNHLTSTRHIKIFVGMFIAASAVALFDTYGVDIPFSNTRGMFTLWAVVFCASQAMFNTTYSTRKRLFIAALAAGLFYYRFGQGITWLSGWLPPLAGLVVLIMLRSRKLAVLIIILGIAYLSFNSSFFNKVFQAEEEESGGTRLAAWQTNWLVTREHLFLGTGPAGYAAYYMTYYPDRGMATHNNYLDVVSQTGLLGIVPFIWTLIAGAYCIRKTYKHVPHGGFEHAAVAGLLAAFVGMLVAAGLGDWMLPFPYTQGIAGYDYTIWAWLVIGLVMVVYRMYGSSKSAEAEK